MENQLELQNKPYFLVVTTEIVGESEQDFNDEDNDNADDDDSGDGTRTDDIEVDTFDKIGVDWICS